MSRWQKATLAGILATIICLLAVASTNARERSRRREELERQTHVVALQLTSRVRSGLETHSLAIQQMATFFEQSKEVTEREFHDFAASTLQRTPLCLRIPVLDSSFHVRWVHPYEQNRSLVGFDARTHREGYETALRAMQTKELALSSPLTLVGGTQGFALTTPIFRKGEFQGAVICSVRSADFFAAMSLPQVLERYDETVTDEGTRLFESASPTQAGLSVPGVTEQFSLGGRSWQMEVRPRMDNYLAQLRSGETVYWLLGCLVAVAVGAGVCGGTLRALEMTTRLRSQGETLEQTKERLDGAMQQLLQAEKLTALGELVAGVAHEVNNPLAGILGYTQLVLRENLPSEVRRRLETVCSEAERAGRIVKNLLTFARKHPPEKRYLGLNGIIEKTLELKAYHFRVSQVQLQRGFAPDLPKTMIDFHQIQQVLLNLLNNAEQAMAETGRGGTIRLSTRAVGGIIEARVSDTGPGIRLDNQKRIFEPFFTTKKEGKGTGLGLSLCYGILQEHGGNIRVESQPGHGATFIIELPIMAEPGKTAEAPSGVALPPVGQLSILVIDDELTVQAVLVELLTEAGHRVDTASDMPEALQKITAGGHDLIISDMKMPHGTGKDIYEAVALKAPHLARRVVFTTGDGASEETLRRFREMGREILMKPYRLEEIERVVSAAIRS